ncbi:hypothetical protein RND81_04G051500 [Saponaria officinalis]|uniref:Reverse transcriptase n=1 Tax=Saponaria officinalis TaxID=3572 RepID=A0AAW1LF16_SAPOF
MHPNTGIKHFPIQLSDHAPIEVDTNLTKDKRSRPYKLEAWNFEYEDCLTLIENRWNLHVNGSASFVLMRKLSNIRNVLKSWSLNKKQEWNRKWSDFDDNLSKALEGIFEGGDTKYYEEEHERLKEFSRMAAIYWRQRTKIRWFIEGDTCTRYFFNWVKGRAGKNFILGVKLSNDEWTYDPIRIGEEFRNYYMSILANSPGEDNAHELV